MAQLPIRSLRLRSYATQDLDRLTGDKGEIFYDSQLQTLKIYNGAGSAASTVKVGEITVDRLVNGSRSLVLAANGALTISGDIRSENNINIEINLADSTLQRWQFGEDGSLTFPDGTSQTTAWLGAGTPVYTSLIDSLDSSAITVTPAVIFSSDVAIENDLTLNTGTINSAEATWRLQGIDLTLPEYGTVTAKTAITLQAEQVAGPDVAAASGLYAEVFALLFSYSDVVIRANNNGVIKDWTFGANGTLTAPGSVNAPNIFTNLIDSADSSAITVTPSVLFSSDVTVEHDLRANGSRVVTIGSLQSLLADSPDFADFKSRVAALLNN